MKASIFLLALLLTVFSFAVAHGDEPHDDEPIVGGYTPLDWNGEDQELTDLLKWGVQEAIWEAIESGELEDGEWHWTEVNSVSSQVVAGPNYDFDVDITNGEGQTVDLDLVIWNQPWTETKEVLSWDVDDDETDSQ